MQMRKSVDPKIFVAVIVAVVLVLGFWFYRSAQAPAAKPPSAALTNTMKPGSEQYKQGMMNSMQKAHRDYMSPR